jgi:hypothetical protein
MRYTVLLKGYKIVTSFEGFLTRGLYRDTGNKDWAG